MICKCYLESIICNPKALLIIHNAASFSGFNTGLASSQILFVLRVSPIINRLVPGVFKITLHCKMILIVRVNLQSEKKNNVLKMKMIWIQSKSLTALLMTQRKIHTCTTHSSLCSMPFNDIPTKVLFILKKSVKGKYIN